jgi:hypothetical protein
MTMHSIDTTTLKDMIRHVVFEENEVLMVIGPSGAGKTETSHQAASENNALLHPVLLGQYDSVDLKGTPWNDYAAHDAAGQPLGTKQTVWAPASTLPFKGNPLFPTDKPILLFLDELTSATGPVFGVCYQLIQERRVGEHILMPNVRILCAGNRESDKGIVNRMPMPLCNRMVWCELEVSIKAWSMHAQSIGVAPECIAYINWMKKNLMTFDPAKPEKVFATGRSWVKAFKKFYQSTTMPMDVKQAAMAGSVGGGPTTEFWAFVQQWQNVIKLLPSILKDPEHAEIPEELDVLYALALNLSGEITIANSEHINKYLFRLPDDFTTMVWHLACGRDATLYKADGFTSFCKRCKAVWQ